MSVVSQTGLCISLSQTLDLKSYAEKTYEVMMRVADKGDAAHSMASEEAIAVIYAAMKSVSLGVFISQPELPGRCVR